MLCPPALKMLLFHWFKALQIFIVARWHKWKQVELWWACQKTLLCVRQCIFHDGKDTELLCVPFKAVLHACCALQLWRCCYFIDSKLCRSLLLPGDTSESRLNYDEPVKRHCCVSDSATFKMARTPKGWLQNSTAGWLAVVPSSSGGCHCLEQ